VFTCKMLVKISLQSIQLARVFLQLRGTLQLPSFRLHATSLARCVSLGQPSQLQLTEAAAYKLVNMLRSSERDAERR
jgi:hypothetical protein